MNFVTFNRRQCLTLIGTATTGSLAGCIGDESSETNGEQNVTTDPSKGSNGENNTDTKNGTGDSSELLFLSELGDRNPPYFDTAARTFTGSGEAVTDTIDPGSGLTAAIFEYNHSSSFLVYFDNDSTPSGRLAEPVNEPGTRIGAGASPMDDDPFYMSVWTDSDWQITIAQPRTPQTAIRTPPVTASGSGQSVVGPIELTGGETISGEHEGEHSFILDFLPESSTTFGDPTLRFLSTSSEGEAVNQTAGIGWFNVNADGDWSLQIE